jgi:hypothetical protein
MAIEIEWVHSWFIEIFEFEPAIPIVTQKRIEKD